MPKRRLLQSVSHPSVSMHDYRCSRGVIFGSGRVCDGALVNQMRPWCLFALRDTSLEILANFATLKQAQRAYEQHCLTHAGLEPK